MYRRLYPQITAAFETFSVGGTESWLPLPGYPWALRPLNVLSGSAIIHPSTSEPSVMCIWLQSDRLPKVFAPHET